MYPDAIVLGSPGKPWLDHAIKYSDQPCTKGGQTAVSVNLESTPHSSARDLSLPVIPERPHTVYSRGKVPLQTPNLMDPWTQELYWQHSVQGGLWEKRIANWKTGSDPRVTIWQT